MFTDDIRCALIKRKSIDDEWDYGVQLCWQEEIKIMSQDMDKTIDFLDNECTAEEFSLLSEVFEDIAEQTQSQPFVDCLYRVAKKYPEETQKYNVMSFIDTANALIDKQN